MPFDPAQPAAHSALDSQVMRNQLNALKALIDAQPAVAYGRVLSDWTRNAEGLAVIIFSSFPSCTRERTFGSSRTARGVRVGAGDNLQLNLYVR